MQLVLRIAATLLVVGTSGAWMTALAGGPARDHWREKRLHYENAGGEKGVTTHVYDADGACIRSIWELLDGSRWSTNTYTYDGAGRMTGKHRVFSDGITSDQTFTYDQKGRLVAETFVRSDGAQGTVRHEFSDDGSVETAICDRMNGWLTGTIRYQLDGDRGRVSGALERDGRKLGTIRFTRNGEGLVETEHWQIGNWTQTFRHEYERVNCLAPTTSNPYVPGDCNVRVSHEDYTFDGKMGGPSAYRYGDDGRLLEKVFIRSDGVRTVTRYEYDSHNILKASTRTFQSGRETRFAYTVDAHRRLVLRSWIDGDGKPCKELYEYGSDGRLARARYVGMDGWLTGDLVFRHDRYGRLETGTFVGDNGLTATIRFTCGEHDLPEVIRWEFDDGHFQEYRFTYEPVP